jgi:hypothetical protein
MRIRRLLTFVGTLFWILALSMAGCNAAQQTVPAEKKPVAEIANGADEMRGVADVSLGKQSEILARGDLALNGREQLLVVNPNVKGTATGAGGANRSTILVTRAAVFEKNGDKWAEIFRADEHLKNPYGYLGGSPVGQIYDWQLEFSQDSKYGLEMKFTSAAIFDAINVHTGEHVELKNPTFDVRWNKSKKRYQSFDQSHERYLSEVPSLETPQSILK